jgi:hypothetical protein
MLVGFRVTSTVFENSGWWHITVWRKSSETQMSCTANEGPERIQYKCLVPIYLSPEMKLLFWKQNYNVLSPSSYTYLSERDLYISRIGLPILLQENMWTDPGSLSIAHRHTNVEIGTEAALFLEKKYINGTFFAVWHWALSGAVSPPYNPLCVHQITGHAQAQSPIWAGSC